MHERGRERMWICVNVLNAHMLVHLFLLFCMCVFCGFCEVV